VPDDLSILGQEQSKALESELRKRTGKTAREIMADSVAEGTADDEKQDDYENQIDPESVHVERARRTYAGQRLRRVKRRKPGRS
jgi:hypothetical protein